LVDSALSPQSSSLVEPLSERELEVLRLIADGASNQAIAAALVISIGTVKSHINHILGKLAACNRIEAVSRASLGCLRSNHHLELSIDVPVAGLHVILNATGQSAIYGSRTAQRLTVRQ
jgi:DNA-binding CsgD family transcriptional regulator